MYLFKVYVEFKSGIRSTIDVEAKTPDLARKAVREKLKAPHVVKKVKVVK